VLICFGEVGLVFGFLFIWLAFLIGKLVFWFFSWSCVIWSFFFVDGGVLGVCTFFGLC